MTLCDKHINDLKNGHESGLSYFIDKYEDSLSFFAFKIIRNREATEEIVSESFFRLWQNRSTVQNPDNIRSFLFLVTRNACLDFLGSAYEKYMSNPLELSPDLHEERTDILMQIIYNELLQLISSELDKLPKKQAKVFRMSFLEGMKTEEISEVLQTSTTSIYFSRSKALSALRKSLIKRDISLILFFLLIKI